MAVMATFMIVDPLAFLKSSSAKRMPRKGLRIHDHLPCRRHLATSGVADRNGHVGHFAQGIIGTRHNDRNTMLVGHTTQHIHDFLALGKREIALNVIDHEQGRVAHKAQSDTEENPIVLIEGFSFDLRPVG